MPELPRLAQPKTFEKTITLTAARTLKQSESGSRVILNSSTAFTTTLPPVKAGLNFTIFVKVAAAATGHDVVPTGSAAKMFGKASPSGAALAANAGKGRRNTQATSTVGDGLFLWSDGTDWFATPTGTWAETP